MSDSPLLIDKRPDGVAVVTLNRPAKRNAFDDQLIADMIQAFENCEQDSKVKVVLLQATGTHFSAGADLAWMQRMAAYDYEQNRQDAAELARLMHVLNGLAKPTVARVQGDSFGGAIGLIACCDIAIASMEARFCLSEVKLGLAPAVISPYVIRAIGARAARRYFLTAEVFQAEEALRLNLIHQAVPVDQLDSRITEIISALTSNGPHGIRASKKLISLATERSLDQALIDETTEVIAQLRVSEEGQEGLKAFLEKRKPNWS